MKHRREEEIRGTKEHKRVWRELFCRGALWFIGEGRGWRSHRQADLPTEACWGNCRSMSSVLCKAETGKQKALGQNHYNILPYASWHHWLVSSVSKWNWPETRPHNHSSLLLPHLLTASEVSWFPVPDCSLAPQGHKPQPSHKGMNGLVSNFSGASWWALMNTWGNSSDLKAGKKRPKHNSYFHAHLGP